MLEKFRDTLGASGEFAARRRHQALAWMWQRVDSGLREGFRRHPAVRDTLAATATAVEAGSITPTAAAQRLLDLAGQ